MAAPDYVARKESEKAVWFTTPGRCFAVLVADMWQGGSGRRRLFSNSYRYTVEVLDKQGLELHHPGHPAVFDVRERMRVGNDAVVAGYTVSGDGSRIRFAYVEFKRAADGQAVVSMSRHDSRVAGPTGKVSSDPPRTGCAAFHPVLDLAHVNHLLERFGSDLTTRTFTHVAKQPLRNLDAHLMRIVELVDSGRTDDWQMALDLSAPQGDWPHAPGVVWVRVLVESDDLQAYVETMEALGVAVEGLPVPAWDGNGYVDGYPINRMRDIAEAQPHVGFQYLVLPDAAAGG